MQPISLKVLHPRGFVNERHWIFEVLLKDFLGLDYSLEVTDGSELRLTDGDRSLTITDHFFQMEETDWLAEKTLPASPCAYWSAQLAGLDIPLTHKSVPVIFGRPECNLLPNYIVLHLDIFGSAFFMLSRYEEVVLGTRDQYDRFPSHASFAQQNGFLERPIVNEYVEILWSCLHYLWPHLQRKPRVYRNIITCDVDSPYQRGTKNLFRQIGRVGADLSKGDVKQARSSLLNYFVSKTGDYRFDTYYTAIAWMMDVNEAAGNRVTFNFMAGISNPKLDVCYTLAEKQMRSLLRNIHERGHELGLHPSFQTYQNKTLLKSEADTLRQVMDEENLKQAAIGTRQHYLRWHSAKTPLVLESGSFAYDSTLGFADAIGFRCGVCYEYVLYDVINRRVTTLRERPLIVMEASFIAKQYMALGLTPVALARVQALKEYCKLFGGDFVLNWHNSSFMTEAARAFYQVVIKR